MEIKRLLLPSCFLIAIGLAIVLAASAISPTNESSEKYQIEIIGNTANREIAYPALVCIYDEKEVEESMHIIELQPNDKTSIESSCPSPSFVLVQPPIYSDGTIYTSLYIGTQGAIGCEKKAEQTEAWNPVGKVTFDLSGFETTKIGKYPLSVMLNNQIHSEQSLLESQAISPLSDSSNISQKEIAWHSKRIELCDSLLDELDSIEDNTANDLFEIYRSYCTLALPYPANYSI